MRYVFRADATKSSGVGHVMRLFPIAEELISRGYEVLFIGALSSVPWIRVQVHGLGFSKIYSQESDFNSNSRSDVLILDSYSKDVLDKFIVKKNWKKVFVISDQNTPMYDADYRIYPDLEVKSLNYSFDREFSGPMYIPLRKSITKSERHFDNSSKLKIVCVGGGTDPTGFVKNIACVLRGFELDFQATLFSSELVFNQDDYRFTVINLGNQLDFFAESADLIFTTASTSSLEFVARELPMGIGCAIENQKYYYEKLAAIGAAIPIGSYVDGAWYLDATAMSELVSSSKLRGDLKSKCKDLIDLSGTDRIVNLILGT
jgi:spore coat polysaccharide biosynthesis predicted glycosyltransferase SpsG